MLDVRMKEVSSEGDDSSYCFYDEPRWGMFKKEKRQEILDVTI